jgi:predicted transcriptional regulator
MNRPRRPEAGEPRTNRPLFEGDDPLAFYFLGVVMTDGNVSGNRVKLDSKDGAWLEAIRDAVFPNSTVSETGQTRWCIRTPDGQSVFELTDRARVEAIRDETFPHYPVEEVKAELWTVTRRDADLVAWLARYGCGERKSLTLDFPTNIPDGMLRDFVRGLIDGDGSVWIHNYEQRKGETTYAYQYAAVGLVSGSKRLIEGLKAALEAQFDPDAMSLLLVERKSGGTALVPQTGTTYVLRIHNWSAYKFLRWLYYRPELLCLPRKRAVAEALFRIYSTKTDKDERDRLTREAIALRERGLSHSRIMELLHLTRTQAKNYTRSVKGMKATERTYARKTAPDLVAEMRRLREAGFSPGVISKRLGVPKPTVEDNVWDIDAPVTETLEGNVDERQRGIEQIIALLKEGKAIDEVARLTGASRDKVKSWKMKACPGQPITSGKRNTVTEEKKRQMRELKREGLRNEQISERVGLSVATVKKHVSGVVAE